MEAVSTQAGILGLGISGYQSALFLAKRGYKVFVSEKNDTEAARRYAAELGKTGIETELGKHTEKKLKSCDWILISPGIAPSAPIYRSLDGSGIPLYSEIEVAGWFWPADRVIAVTGTSGKTTVTTMLGRVLEACGRKAVVCGNIGNPWIGEIEGASAETYAVVEISSFQLAHCERFRPRYGLLLNITPNHLDWHATMQAYVEAKLRLFQNQGAGDFTVLRRKDYTAFCQRAFLRGKVYFWDEGGREEDANRQAVRCMARLLECEEAVVEGVFERFEALEHRLEVLGTLRGVTFVNDSKATTVAALAWALDRFPDKSVILIAGGRPKSANFDEVVPLMRRKVKKALVLGEAAGLLRQAWASAADLETAGTLGEAVQKGFEAAGEGQTLLLSPACASFDMFASYQDRGRAFKDCFNALKVGV